MNDLQTEIFDIKWSPSHPSVFATGDCEGNIDLLNLGKETEQFIYRKTESLAVKQRLESHSERL